MNPKLLHPFSEVFLEKLCRGYSRYYERKFMAVHGSEMPGMWKELDPKLKHQAREAMEHAWRYALGALNEEENKSPSSEPETTGPNGDGTGVTTVPPEAG